jgi:hypothetical protein
VTLVTLLAVLLVVAALAVAFALDRLPAPVAVPVRARRAPRRG